MCPVSVGVPYFSGVLIERCSTVYHCIGHTYMYICFCGLNSLVGDKI